MFSGDIRRNLDPFGGHTDEQLWAALADVSLKPTIEAMEGGLQARGRAPSRGWPGGVREWA